MRGGMLEGREGGGGGGPHQLLLCGNAKCHFGMPFQLPRLELTARMLLVLLDHAHRRVCALRGDLTLACKAQVLMSTKHSSRAADCMHIDEVQLCVIH